MKKRFGAAVMAVIIAASMTGFTGCGSSASSETANSADTSGASASTAEASASSSGAAGSQKKIAYITNSSANEYQAGTITYLEKYQDAYGYELVVLDGQGDAEKQSNCVANAVSQGVDAIIVCPQDSKAIVPALEAARDEGVPVVDFSTAIPESERGTAYDVFVGCDDSMAAEDAANIMIDNLEPGAKIVMVGGPAGADATNKRAENFEKLISESELELLDYKNCPSGWNADEAFAIMEDFLKKYDQIDGVWVHWDGAAVSVVQAIKDAGRLTDGLIICSVDGDSAGANLVKNGEEFCCLAQPLSEMSESAVKCAIDLADGKVYDEDVIAAFEHVTSENVDSYVPWDDVK